MDEDENNPEHINNYLRLDEKYIAEYCEKVAVFYQLGKFYQLYGSKERMDKICYEDMGISVREIKETGIYTGGFPTTSLKKFSKLLIQSNYIIIVYDQQDQAKSKKKIRVFKNKFSGATCIDEDDLLTDNQTVMCLYLEFEQHCLNNVEICTYEPTTGQSYCFINNTLTSINQNDPQQIVVYTDGCVLTPTELNHLLKLDKKLVHLRINSIPKEYKKIQYQNKFLSELFNSKMLTGVEFIGLGKYPSTIICYLLLLKYMEEFNVSFLQHIYPPKINVNNHSMMLSEKCIEQLNLIDKNNKSLFNIIDHTSTLRGKKYLKFLLMNPTTNISTIQTSYNQIEFMMPYYHLFEIHLGKIMDLEKFHRKINLGTLNPSEIQYLHQSYTSVLEILKLTQQYHIGEHLLSKNSVVDCAHFISDYESQMNINQCKYNIDDEFLTNIFNNDPDLDLLYKNVADLNQQLTDLSKMYSNSVNKNEFKIECKNMYSFHVTDKQKLSLQKLYQDLTFTKKASGYKMTSETIKSIGEKIVDLQSQINKLTKLHYLQFLNVLSTTYNTFFDQTVYYINNMDVIKSNAKTADLEKYCKPVIKNFDKSFINATELRHPIIEKANMNVPYIPNDCFIGDEYDGLIITGVNGVGKTSYSKSIGLSIIMAQAGMYVPAMSFTYNIYKKMGIKMLGGDDIYNNKSFYINEVLMIKEFVELADQNSFIIGDELSTGTDHCSQVGLVAATVQYLANQRSSFIFMTHLHELVDLDIIKQCKNVKMNHLSVIIKDRKMIYERKLKEGSCQSLYGIEIASFLGLNHQIINTAYKVREIVLGNQPMSYKESKHNNNLIVDQCEICQTTQNLNTHHITHQSEFRKKHAIPFNKNAKHNLVVLCTKCHDDVHDNKRKIYGYIQTSDGVELQYE